MWSPMVTREGFSVWSNGEREAGLENGWMKKKKDVSCSLAGDSTSDRSHGDMKTD
jgi:hypothetical protein